MKDSLEKCWRFVRQSPALIGAIILVAILTELIEENGAEILSASKGQEI